MRVTDVISLFGPYVKFVTEEICDGGEICLYCGVYREVRVIKLTIHLELCYVGMGHIKIAWKHSESCSSIKQTQRFLYFSKRDI